MNKVFLLLTSVIAAVFMIIPVMIELSYKGIEKVFTYFAFKSNYGRIQHILREKFNPSTLFKDISWGRYGKIKISH